jgi:hypothetical protein
MIPNLSAEMYVLHELWTQGNHATRTRIVRNCFDLVNTAYGWKTPEAVADVAWGDLTEELKLDLIAGFPE